MGEIAKKGVLLYNHILLKLTDGQFENDELRNPNDEWRLSPAAIAYLKLALIGKSWLIVS